MRVSKKNKKIKFPIGIKLSTIIGFIVLISLGTVTFLNSYFIGQDVKITAENNNLSTNTRAAGTVDNKISTIRANVFQLLDLLNVTQSSAKNNGIAKQAQAFFFERNFDIASIMILSDDGDESSEEKMVNRQFFISNEIEQDVLESVLEQNAETIQKSCAGESIAKNVSAVFQIPCMALFFPWKENGKNQTCVIIFSMESIAEILGSGSESTTFLINDSDELLSHPDSDRILAGQNLRNNPLVKEIRGKQQNLSSGHQIPFEDIDDDGNTKHFFGAFQQLKYCDILILTTVSLDSVLEGVRTTRRNNLYLTGVVFFVSIIVALIFSRYGISRHLGRLAEAANEISAGNFDTSIIDNLDTKRGDEIGVLNQSTKDEKDFLNTFAKFTNRNVAKAVAAKTIDFNPHPKDVTIFFSDIRGFTKISDDFKNRFGNDSATEIISFLNDYMSRMVECVTLSNGSIDKFEGDAIMAVWGILRNDDVSFESMEESGEKNKRREEHLAHVRQDAVDALTGTIAMRYSLMKYNKDAEIFTKQHAGEKNAKYKPHIKIGAGLNSGRASVGLMGSKDKMEYTSIGDAVNFASRTESSNKVCGTDILITQDTYDLLKEKFIRCAENNFTILPENAKNEIVVEMIPVEFEVKGKGTQHFYGVVNLPQFDIEEFFLRGDKNFVLDKDCEKACGKNGPATLNEVRELLGIPKPDFEKVNLNEEENKVQVRQ